MEVADHRKLPVPAHSADLVVSGWSVSYLAVWNQDHGEAELDQWLTEMKRVLRHEGTVILFESLGTGNETPIHLEHVKPVYQWLDAKGFANKWIRTDYQFRSLDEAAELAGFFFGPEMADHIHRKGSVMLAECTGVWWKMV